MQDRFDDRNASITGPAFHGFAVTPNDGAELAEITRALYVGTAGALHVLLASGADVTFAGVAGGTILPIRVRKVLSTGTTGSSIVGLV